MHAHRNDRIVSPDSCCRSLAGVRERAEGSLLQPIANSGSRYPDMLTLRLQIPRARTQQARHKPPVSSTSGQTKLLSWQAARGASCGDPIMQLCTLDTFVRSGTGSLLSSNQDCCTHTRNQLMVPKQY